MTAHVSVFTGVSINLEEEIFYKIYREDKESEKIANKYKIQFSIESEEDDEFYCLYLKDKEQGIVKGCVYTISEISMKEVRIDDNIRKDIRERFIAFIEELNVLCKTDISSDIEEPELKIIVTASI